MTVGSSERLDEETFRTLAVGASASDVCTAGVESTEELGRSWLVAGTSEGSSFVVPEAWPTMHSRPDDRYPYSELSKNRPNQMIANHLLTSHSACPRCARSLAISRSLASMPESTTVERIAFDRLASHLVDVVLCQLCVSQDRLKGI